MSQSLSTRRSQLAVAITVAGIIAGTGIAFFFNSDGRSSPISKASVKKHCATPSSLSVSTAHYVGAVVKPVTARPPFKSNIGEFYTGFGGHFPGTLASKYRSEGMVPFIQVNPRNFKLTGIAAGHYDVYLQTFARDARRFCTALIYSFGHEMNGSWYSWGYRHTSAFVFVKAWRHIHNIFAQEHATNVIWAWDPDHAAHNPSAWWPGAAYVNWIGIDGYFRKPAQSSFKALFVNRIAEIRKLSKAPILIAETGAPPSKQRPKQIRVLFGGIRKYGLLGVVWFDVPGLQDYRINHDRPALRVFNQEIKSHA